MRLLPEDLPLHELRPELFSFFCLNSLISLNVLATFALLDSSDLHATLFNYNFCGDFRLSGESARENMDVRTGLAWFSALTGDAEKSFIWLKNINCTLFFFPFYFLLTKTTIRENRRKVQEKEGRHWEKHQSKKESVGGPTQSLCCLEEQRVRSAQSGARRLPALRARQRPPQQEHKQPVRQFWKPRQVAKLIWGLRGPGHRQRTSSEDWIWGGACC